ncbi:thioredoxin family protein [Fusibacter sp. JL216-2]|uniref:thioredoxin family protein n=1 Tax=Fusibacter sp. JL216-2 TaxID=3071453 RepID=UPI003D3486B9
MLKELFNAGHDFETFMQGDEGKHVDNVRHFLELSSDAMTDVLTSRIKEIESARLVVFGEVWCPDCMINMAVLESIHRVNTNIEYAILPRDGYEDKLKSLTPDSSAKIPTFIVVDSNWNAKGMFLEKPQVVKDVEAGDDQVKRIVVKRDYRKGKYILDTIEELVELL